MGTTLVAETIDRQTIYQAGNDAAQRAALDHEFVACPYWILSVEGQIWMAGFEDAGGYA